MKLKVNMRPLQNVDWYTVYARALTVGAVAALVYCGVRLVFMFPDTKLSDDVLSSRGAHINSALYDTITDYRQNSNALSSAELPAFREPL